MSIYLVEDGQRKKRKSLTQKSKKEEKKRRSVSHLRRYIHISLDTIYNRKKSIATNKIQGKKMIKRILRDERGKVH